MERRLNPRAEEKKPPLSENVNDLDLGKIIRELFPEDQRNQRVFFVPEEEGTGNE
jgi:hypothetical protein